MAETTTKMTEPRSCTGWNVDTLERHFSMRCEALEKMILEREARSLERMGYVKESVVVAMQSADKMAYAARETVAAAMASSDKAVAKAEAAAEARFASVNEFRATLADQAERLLPRAEYQVQHGAMAERIEAVTRQVLSLESSSKGKKEGLGSVGTIVVALIAGVSALAAVGSVIAAITIHH